MKILLLGATGRTGKLVLQEAIDKNYTVNCVVRSLPAFNHPNVRFFIGNPGDENILSEAMHGCEAIINVLNISRTSDFPWSPLRTPQTFLSDTMKKVVSLAVAKNINRIVVCTAWGTSDTRNDLPKWFSWFINNSNIGIAYRDHERQEELLQQSTLKWTIVRPSGLTNSKKPQRVMESYQNQPKPTLTISRSAVAGYLIMAVTNDNLIGKMPVVSGKSA